MKLRSVLMIMVVSCGVAVAQTTSSQAGTSTANPHAQHQPAAGAASTNKMGDMSSHMAQMQAEMQQMRTQVQQMRTDAEKVQDANTKTALLDNAKMWENFLDRMHSHMQMMMREGMMGHGMMGGMKEKPGSTTAPPK